MVDKKKQHKWFVFAVLTLAFMAIVLARIQQAPATARANNTSTIVSEQARDLSKPSSRIVGHWKNVDDNSECYFSPIDPDRRIDTYRLRDKPSGRSGHPSRFKVVFESPSATQLVMYPYDKNEFLRNLNNPSGETNANPWMTDIVYTIAKHGQSMTEEYIFSGRPIVEVYRYVDNKTGPQ